MKDERNIAARGAKYGSVATDVEFNKIIDGVHAAKFNGSTSNIDILDLLNSIDGSHTVLASYRSNGSMNNAFVIQGESGSDDFTLSVKDTGSASLRGFGAETGGEGLGVLYNFSPANQFYSIGFTWDKDSLTLKQFLDGDLVQTTTSYGGNMPQNYTLGGIGRGSFSSYLEYVYIIEGAVPDGVVQSLQNNPYQFLKSTRPPLRIESVESLSHEVYLPRRSPELMIPNRKPVGNVEIDLMKPYAESIKYYWLFQSDGKDLVKGNNILQNVNSNPVITGGALSLDTNDSCYSSDISGLSALTDKLTVFIDFVYKGGSGEFILSKSTVAGSYDFGIYVLNYTLQLYVSTSSGVVQVSTTTVPVDGNRYRVFMTYDGANISAYVDGKHEGQAAQTGDITNNGTQIGCNHWSGIANAADIYSAFIAGDVFPDFLIRTLAYDNYRFLKSKNETKARQFNHRQQKQRVILPDSRIEMPELLIPGRKPSGNVEVDKDHWAGKHLRDSFHFIKDMGRSDFENLYPELTFFTQEPEIVNTIKGRAVNTDGVLIYSYPCINDTGFFTWEALIRVNSATSQAFCGRASAATAGSNTYRSFGINSSGKFTFYAYASAIEIATASGGVSPTAETGAIYHIVGVAKPTGLYIYVNGMLEGARVKTITVLDCPAQYFNLHTGYNGSMKSFDGDIIYFREYDTYLSDAEVAALSRDPFRFMVSA